MEYKDYYKILGVERGASTDEIKRAYRRLARKYHPDVSSEADAEQRFKEVSEAYEVLKDPEKRRAYDQLGSAWQAGEDFRPPPGWERAGATGGFGGGFRESADFSDFFESLFGGGSPFEAHFGGGAGRTGSRRRGFSGRGQDQTARIQVDLEDAYNGATRTISLESTEPDAQGQLRRATRSLKVHIPKGVSNGQQIRLAGQGSPGPGGGQAGDLLLEVHIRPHRLFHLRGRDIHLDLPVAPWEAALGTSVKAPTLGGRVDLKVPAGSQAGKQLRLKGRGLPGNPPGDQYVTLKIVNPPATTEGEKAAFRELAKAFDFDPRSGL